MIPLPVGSYQTADVRASNRRLVNCMSEPSPEGSPLDAKQKFPATYEPAYLRRMAGIKSFSSIVNPGTGQAPPTYGVPPATLPTTWDAYYADVELLLHLDGMPITDFSLNANASGTLQSTASISNVNPKSGAGSLLVPPWYYVSSNPSLAYPVSAGSALDFASGTGDYTLEMWVKMPTGATADVGTIANLGTTLIPLNANYNNGYEWRLEYVPSGSPINNMTVNLYQDVNGGSYGVSASVSTAVEVWHHIAVCRAANLMYLFIDGVGAVGNGGPAWNPFSYGPNPAFLCFGLRDSSASGNGVGLDDIRLTKGLARYTANFVPPTVPFASTGYVAPFIASGAVRGMHDMLGVTYAVIGNGLFTVADDGALTEIANGIPGNGLVRIVDNTACLVILVPGTRYAYTYTFADGFQVLSDPVFAAYGALDCGFVDSYIVFLSLDGLVFYNDDGKAASGTGPITFNSGAVFPREFGTDPFKGMIIDHRTVLMFGVRTTEGYTNSGNATFSPFSSAPDSFMEIGIHPDATYSVILQDQAPFWLADDLTIRRRDGQTPVRVSNSGVEAILEENKLNLAGCYAMKASVGGHPLYVLTIPLASRTLIYDCLTTEWFEAETLENGLGYWRPLCIYNAKGLQLVGDSQASQIGYLDFATFTEFGDPMRATVTTQSIYDSHNRLAHRRLEAIVTAGNSPSLTTGAYITAFKSDDSGATYKALPMRSLGRLGNRKARAVWFNLGQSRDRTYKFEITDPTETFFVDIQAEIEGGKW